MTQHENAIGRRCRLLFDILLGILLVIAGIFLEIRMRPKRIGFFCNDETLQYPYQRDTVSPKMLLAIAFLMPLLLINIVELACCLVKSKIPRSSLKSRLFYFLQQFGRHYGYYIIGLFLTFNTAQVAKLTIGRLRPHFLAVCQPQLPDGRNCSDPSLQERYIEDYECIAKGFTARDVRQIHYSFPSHHSAVCFYAMLYLALYLQKRFKWSGSRLVRHILQFCLLMLAWYAALTRIADHWHHWSDVVAGISMGVTVALIHVFFIARMFEEPTTKSEEKRPQHVKEDLEQAEDCIEQQGLMGKFPEVRCIN